MPWQIGKDDTGNRGAIDNNLIILNCIAKRCDTSAKKERKKEIILFTTDKSTAISFTNPSLDLLEKSIPLPVQRSEFRGDGVTEVFILDGDFDEMEEAQQVDLNIQIILPLQSLNFRISVISLYLLIEKAIAH